MYLILIRAVLSWFSPDPYNAFYQILIRITEPILNYIRRVLPFRTGMMDFSPFIAIIAIIFLREFLVKSLFGLAARIG